MSQMIKGNTGEFLPSPSPFQGEGGVGVIDSNQDANPHPNLPPKRGKESVTIYQHQPRNQTLKKYSRQLRREMTDAERHLWYHLRREALGVKFRRQYPVGPYIADFVCLEKKIIVEVDGGQHAQKQEYDAKRDAILSAEGFMVLRFWNNDVLQNIEGVVEKIMGYITPLPNPLPQGERGL